MDHLINVYPGSGPPSAHLEERTRFEAVCDNITSERPVMVELGCFWALWTIIFGKRFENAKLIVLEAHAEKLAAGLTNLYLNGLVASVHCNVICPRPWSATLQKEAKKEGCVLPNRCDIKPWVREITLAEILQINKIESIDLLHLDIQGSEFELYKNIFYLMESNKVKNVVMATHYFEEHQEMMEMFETLPHHSVAGIVPDTTDGEIIITDICGQTSRVLA